METSRALTGSSQTMKRGPERQGARDADALPLAAGELVREAVGVIGLEAHLLERIHHDVQPFLAAADVVDVQPFHDRLPDGQAGIQRSVGILEDDLHVAAQGFELGSVELEDVAAVEVGGPGGRIDQPQHGAPDGRLAAAGFADQAERLALLDAETHIVNGLDLVHDAVQDAGAHGKVLCQMFDPHQGVVGGLVVGHE